MIRVTNCNFSFVSRPRRDTDSCPIAGDFREERSLDGSHRPGQHCYVSQSLMIVEGRDYQSGHYGIQRTAKLLMF